MCKFSIIIPLYNKEKYISQTLTSVLNQNYKDYEVIIVNDSSTDNSLEIVKTFNDKRIKIYTKMNNGVSAARNYGINMAKGEYLAFLDADDLWHPNYLLTMLFLTNKYHDCDIFGMGYKTFENDNIYNIMAIHNLKDVFDKDDFYLEPFFKIAYKKRSGLLLTSSVIVRSNYIKSFSCLFPEGINCGEDIDLWIRLVGKSKVAYSNECLMYYRANTDNSLYMTYRTDLDKTIDYRKWLHYDIVQPYFKNFVSMFILTRAADLCKGGFYKESLDYVKNIYYWPGVKCIKPYIIIIINSILHKKIFKL